METAKKSAALRGMRQRCVVLAFSFCGRCGILGVAFFWQEQHLRKVKYGFDGRRSVREILARTCCESRWQRRRMVGAFSRYRGLARLSTHFVAGAALSQGQVQILWQAQHFRRSSTDFVAGAALSQASAKSVAGRKTSR